MVEVGEGGVLKNPDVSQQKPLGPRVSSDGEAVPLDSAMETIISQGDKSNPDKTLEELAGISPRPPEEATSSKIHFDKSRFTTLCKTVDSLYGRYNLWETKPEKYYKAVRYIGDRRELSDEKLRQLMDALHSQADSLKKALRTDEYYTPTLQMMRLLMHSSKQKHAHELGEFATSFVQENLPYIETVLRETDDKTKIGRSLNAVANLSYFGDKGQSELGVDFLLRNFEPILRQSKDTELLRDQLRIILIKGNDTQINIASNLALKLIKDEDPNLRKFVKDEISGVVGGVGLRYESIRRVAKDILQEYEIDYNTVVKAWADSGRSSDFMKVVNANIRMIFELESQRPGIVKTLINDYKIYDFARYPTEMLVEQYDQRDNKDLPYGIVLYPRSDWNGAFYHNIKVFRELFVQLKEKGYRLRIFEVGSMYDVARSLIKADQRYGQNHKISFAIVGGHGKWDSIQFGSEKERFDIFGIKDQPETKRDNLSLKQPDLRGRGAQRSIEFFEKNPTVILNSCTTGTNRGIAQEISRLGATVIGPDDPRSFKNIRVISKNHGRLNFEVNYYHDRFWGKAGKKYTGGQKD